MKHAILAACAALSLSPLAACAPITQGITLSQTLKDEKALYAAEAAYFGAASAAEAAVDSGALKGERAVQVADALQTAYSALVVARQAHLAGMTFDRSTASAEALGAIAMAYQLMQGNP